MTGLIAEAILNETALSLLKESATIAVSAGAVGAVVLRWMRSMIGAQLGPVVTQLHDLDSRVTTLAKRIDERITLAEIEADERAAMTRILETISRPGGPLAQLEANGGQSIRDMLHELWQLRRMHGARQ